MNIKQLKKLTTIKYLIIIFIILIAFLFYWLLSRSFLYITVYPTTAIVTVDNAPITVKNNGKGKAIVKPGKHTIKIDADGYIGQSSEYNFVGGLTKNLNFSLVDSPASVRVASDADFLTKGKNKNEIIYLGNSRKTLYKTTLASGINDSIDFTTIPITDSILSDIENIIWSPDKSLALFKKSNGYYLFDFQKYDFINQTQNFWGSDIGNIAWSPDNSKIAYYNNVDKTLIFSNIANTQQDRVLNFDDYSIENPILRWSPDSEWLLVIPQNQDKSQNKIYLLSVSSRMLTMVADTGNQIDAVFSPDSGRIIYKTSSSSGSSSTISIMDRNGQNKKALNLDINLDNITWIKNDTFLAASYDQISQKYQISKFNISSGSSSGSILKIDSPIKSLINTSSFDAKTLFIASQTKDSIYAFKISE